MELFDPRFFRMEVNPGRNAQQPSVHAVKAGCVIWDSFHGTAKQRI